MWNQYFSPAIKILIVTTAFLDKPAAVNSYQYAVITGKGYLNGPSRSIFKITGVEVDTPTKCRTICINLGALYWNYHAIPPSKFQCNCPDPGKTWEEIKAIDLADPNDTHMTYDQTCTAQVENEPLDVVPSGEVPWCLASVEMPVSGIF